MVRNISKEGKEIKDISKVTVPVNKHTVRAYEIIAKSRGKKWEKKVLKTKLKLT